MKNTVSLAELDSAIAEALKGTRISGGRVIYGFLPPDWYDHDEAFDLAKKVTSKLGGDVEPAALKVKGSRLGLGKGIKDPYIVGFIGPIDLRLDR